MDPGAIVTIEMIITILAVSCSALTIYYSMKKIGDNIRAETVWRTTTSIDIRSIISTTAEIKLGLKDNSEKIRKLSEETIRQQGEIESLKKELVQITGRIDNSCEISKR